MKSRFKVMEGTPVPLGAEIICAAGPFNDGLLMVVLCVQPNGEHVTWTYNRESKGFALGVYGKNAVEAFVDRVRWNCRSYAAFAAKETN